MYMYGSTVGRKYYGGVSQSKMNGVLPLLALRIHPTHNTGIPFLFVLTNYPGLSTQPSSSWFQHCSLSAKLNSINSLF